MQFGPHGRMVVDTTDVDCLDPIIPKEVLIAAADFRKANPDLQLIEAWLNNGPEILITDLEVVEVQFKKLRKRLGYGEYQRWKLAKI